MLKTITFKKAAVRVKGQMTDGPIAKNNSCVMFYLCTKYHAFIAKQTNTNLQTRT